MGIGGEFLDPPESFVRGGPTQFRKRFCCCFFLVHKGGEDPNTTKSGDHHCPASETPFTWRFASGPMMACHGMLAW